MSVIRQLYTRMLLLTLRTTSFQGTRMFSVLRLPLDASYYYYVYISPAYLPNWHHGTISYQKKKRPEIYRR